MVATKAKKFDKLAHDRNHIANTERFACTPQKSINDMLPGKNSTCTDWWDGCPNSLCRCSYSTAVEVLARHGRDVPLTSKSNVSKTSNAMMEIDVLGEGNCLFRCIDTNSGGFTHDC
jgi:hypothetical protein